ncbi:cation:proton antiporter domain-containing protein [Shouchella clausii]|uniref:cation:proton antiporter domain-containing protein n=1 Tax=Shouchella clausii TaxID=79880 RepID=UPI003F592A10
MPLIQIALGMLCSISPTAGLHIPLEPELFFVLFIAPLLFNDGKVTPRDELWKLRLPILLLALGLVFATVVVIGLFIHWLIPSIPLPAAFALAAILSPTDVVAVSSIAKRVHMPKGLMRLLEGEGLMNDASGLVAFKFAVAATVTGIFSVSEASVSFLLIALGGLGLGVLFSFMLIGLKMAGVAPLWHGRYHNAYDYSNYHAICHLYWRRGIWRFRNSCRCSGRHCPRD